MLNQGFGAAGVLRINRHANAETNPRRMAARQNGAGGDVQQTAEHRLDFPDVLEAVHDQNKLVAANAGQKIAVARHRADAPCHRLQHLVAHHMPVLVVDGLESVKVDEAHRQTAQPRGLNLGHALLQLHHQRIAVGQAGQGVVVGLVGELGVL